LPPPENNEDCEQLLLRDIARIMEGKWRSMNDLSRRFK